MPWLALVGSPGTGKTSLGAALANDRIARGKAALYVVAPDLLDHLRAAYRKDADVPYPHLFEQVRTRVDSKLVRREFTITPSR